MTKKELSKMIANVYKERELAHKNLLACDLFIDTTLKELLNSYEKMRKLLTK